MVKHHLGDKHNKVLRQDKLENVLYVNKGNLKIPSHHFPGFRIFVAVVQLLNHV